MSDESDDDGDVVEFAAGHSIAERGPGLTAEGRVCVHVVGDAAGAMRNGGGQCLELFGRVARLVAVEAFA